MAGGSDLGLHEANRAAETITKAAHPEANIIFGAVIDDALGDECRVTVIAAGFDKFAPAERRGTYTFRQELPVGLEEPSTEEEDEEIPVPSLLRGEEEDEEDLFQPAHAGGSLPAFEEQSDDLDIPDFLKR